MDEKELEKTNDPKVEDTKDEGSWKFEAEAPTLNANIIGNEEFEIEIPESSKYETAQRPTKSTKKEEEAPKPAKKVARDKLIFIITGIIVGIAIIVAAVFGGIYYNSPNSNERMTYGNTAMVAGKTKVSIGMYNYYYTCVSENYIQYANYGYYDIDTTKSYSEQYTTDNDGNKITWAEKFQNDTIDQIQYITAYYEEAVANGVTLSDEQTETIASSISSLKSSAASSLGKDSSQLTDDDYNAYIASTYGDYCGVATLQKMLEQCYIAENYYQEKLLDFKVTTDEEKAYFEEHKDNYLNVGFAYLQVPYNTDEDGNVTSSSLDQCNEYISQISSVDDMKKLIPTACKTLIDSYVSQGYATDADECATMLSANIEVTISKNETGFITEAIDWLFSDDTPIGACKAFDDADNGVVYILYKTTEPQEDKTQVYSVRHILVTPQADETESTTTTEYTDEQWAAAKTEADEILEKYNAGDKTESSFAKLAEEYSDDTESTSKGSSGYYGGLYAGTKLGTMVKSFENWAIDESRQYGDVDIVQSDYGYHIMYFVENTEQYLYNCKTAIQSDMEKEFVEKVKIKQHKGAMKKVKIAAPTASTTTSSSSSSTAQ